MTLGHKFCLTFSINAVSFWVFFFLAAPRSWMNASALVIAVVCTIFAVEAYHRGKPNSNQLSKSNAQYKGSPSRQR